MVVWECEIDIAAESESDNDVDDKPEVVEEVDEVEVEVVERI